MVVVAQEGHNSGQINVTAQRGDGAYPAPDLVDPLITSLEAALSRGRAEMDRGEALQIVRLATVFRAGGSPGQLIEVHNNLQGQAWRGQITGVDHKVDLGRTWTELEVVRR
jgi:hypothetical protein